MSRYQFRSALCGFFHADASRAASVLPESMVLVESHPGLAVLAVTVFDFHASEVGPYQELVASLVVLPWAPRGERLPDVAVFPFLLATSTEVARDHSVERWRLPKLDRCLAFELDRSSDERVAVVRDGGQLVLRLRVTGQKMFDSRRAYQYFGADAEHLYRSVIEFEGQLSEHEDERGALELGDHELAASLASLLDDPIPFREQCMDAGEERFGELVRHAPRGRGQS
jgi:hypothetical protein